MPFVEINDDEENWVADPSSIFVLFSTFAGEKLLRKLSQEVFYVSLFALQFTTGERGKRSISFIDFVD